jgi:tetratricopeptide (TPR) repeat protein
VVRRGRPWIGYVAVMAALTGGCQKSATTPAAAPAAPDPIAEARQEIEQGQPDAALAKLLTGAQGPENLCLQGAAWAKKAEGAPLPTPTIGADGVPVTAEFKSEERRAIDLFQRALSEQPALAEAHLGLAELLVPHAIRRYELGAASRRARPRRRGAAPTPVPAEPLLEPGGIVEHFKAASKDPKLAMRALDGLARFATRVDRPKDREWAYRGLVDAEPENPSRLVELGDFLLKERGDPNGAIAEYKQALVWKPDSSEIKAKIADIYIEEGRVAFQAEQWAVAEARFVTAQEWVTDPNSAQGLRVRDYRSKLDAIRRTPGRR